MLKKLLPTTRLFLGLFIGFGILVSCAGKPTQSSGRPDPYRLISKAKVTDKLSGESHNIDLTVIVDPQRAVRIDVTALLGYRLAEMVMNPTQIQYIERENKIFVTGGYKPKTLKPLFGQEIDPKLIWSIAHEQNLKDGRYYGTEVKFELTGKPEDDYQSRKITIENKHLKMIWIFKSKEALSLSSPSYNETFVLTQPEEYKLITIK
ncbi:MAG: DUF4292 domain-containing protein [Bdellovibrionaceae bacterium]|nr:DUF4292 domain-containing protein [Pseudobdellovibrionaceae bacterium]